MRNLNLKFLVLLLAFSTAGCSDENEPNAVPVAPILKEVVMPAESKALPGTTVTISGKGFDVTDSSANRSRRSSISLPKSRV